MISKKRPSAFLIHVDDNTIYVQHAKIHFSKEKIKSRGTWAGRGGSRRNTLCVCVFTSSRVISIDSLIQSDKGRCLARWRVGPINNKLTFISMVVEMSKRKKRKKKKRDYFSCKLKDIIGLVREQPWHVYQAPCFISHLFLFFFYFILFYLIKCLFDETVADR